MHQSEHPVAAVVFSLAWILLYAVERNRVDCLWVSLPGALATVIETLSTFIQERKWHRSAIEIIMDRCVIVFSQRS